MLTAPALFATVFGIIFVAELPGADAALGEGPQGIPRGRVAPVDDGARHGAQQALSATRASEAKGLEGLVIDVCGRRRRWPLLYPECATATCSGGRRELRRLYCPGEQPTIRLNARPKALCDS